MPDNIDDNSKNGNEAVSPEKFEPIFEPINAADIPLSKPLTEAINPGANQPANSGPATSNHPAHTAPTDASRRWIYGAILAAIACVLLLFIATVYQGEPTTPTENLADDKQTSTTENTSTIEENPFQKAQLAAARRSAQDILARVLEKQQALEALNIQQWAA
ncbi:MAG: hypothetical protein KUG60_02865, partial [Gammaproteobacteria bacterium]|nr:hypothetical protein [Gammaproteobacteria bacterium]